jgi:hypothetical protein
VKNAGNPVLNPNSHNVWLTRIYTSSSSKGNPKSNCKDIPYVPLFILKRLEMKIYEKLNQISAGDACNRLKSDKRCNREAIEDHPTDHERCRCGSLSAALLLYPLVVAKMELGSSSSLIPSRASSLVSPKGKVTNICVLTNRKYRVERRVDWAGLLIGSPATVCQVGAAQYVFINYTVIFS